MAEISTKREVLENCREVLIRRLQILESEYWLKKAGLDEEIRLIDKQLKGQS